MKLLKTIKKSIEIDPDSTDPYCGLATIYYDIGLMDEAIKNYKKLLKQDLNLHSHMID